MKFGRFRHKGLKALWQNDNAKGLPAAMADKCRKQLDAIHAADYLEQLGTIPGWRLHPLKGEWKGFWSLSVSGNWRLIFSYDEEANCAADFDLIDYH